LRGDGQLEGRDLALIRRDVRANIVEGIRVAAQVGVLQEEDAVGHTDAAHERRRFRWGIGQVGLLDLRDLHVGIHFVESGDLLFREEQVRPDRDLPGRRLADIGRRDAPLCVRDLRDRPGRRHCGRRGRDPFEK